MYTYVVVVSSSYVWGPNIEIKKDFSKLFLFFIN